MNLIEKLQSSMSLVFTHIPYGVHATRKYWLTVLQKSNSTNWSSATLAVSTAAHSTMSTTSTENTSTAMRCVHRLHHPSRSTPQAASGNSQLGARLPGNQTFDFELLIRPFDFGFFSIYPCSHDLPHYGLRGRTWWYIRSEKWAGKGSMLSVCSSCPFWGWLFPNLYTLRSTIIGVVLLGPNPRQLEAWAMFHLDLTATTLSTPTTTSTCKLGPFWPVSSTWLSTLRAKQVNECICVCFLHIPTSV